MSRQSQKLQEVNRDRGQSRIAISVFTLSFIAEIFLLIAFPRLRPILAFGTLFGVPTFWAVFFGFPLLLAVVFWYFWERPRKLRSGRFSCKNCGYPIIGTGRCSECGWEVPRLPGEKKRW